MSKKKKGRGEGKSKAVGMELEVLTAAAERIVTLQNEYDEMVKELKQLKLKIYDLRKENEFLEKEAQQTRLETHEYIVQMSKRTEKRQNQIITLNDQNHQNLEEIRNAKERILAEFEVQKQELEMEQVEKENELLQLKKEIEDLGEYKELREQQLARISELDNLVMDARAKHSQCVHDLKLNFNKEKAEYKQNARRMVKQLEKDANKEAVCCLIEHMESIKVENQQLREVLVCLIRRSRVLHEQQEELEAQHKQLLQERDYCTKLRTLRYRKQLSEYVEPKVKEESETKEQPKVEVEPETKEQPKVKGEPETKELPLVKMVSETEESSETKDSSETKEELTLEDQDDEDLDSDELEDG
ncbi:coiled-coil domain-containing protein 166 [Stegostoma tigrinum]|uniref:coiled-coil domain-containing protein 166 n=1 Tax=Stegostoma tigrinum TaxID=3053191 RepID=UPI00202B27D7|nr:coiled-coil domain-containing protein 166 [Stegostoma tigrinum]XP_048392117.1 coiled-coil domain-containing protein 166 [Stegostoma tigrinum]XP_059506515.1 coiled-coil domain-containing protein 166 [Stegostoma tigrinum]